MRKNPRSTPRLSRSALHNYKSQPGANPATAAAIDTLQNRFDFASFMTTGAARQAFFEPTNQFGCCTYSGYTSEHKVIALAAEVSDSFHVPLASQWNKDTGRTLASLVDPQQNHLVYSFGTDYRAPFVQALLNLFVDTSDRGADNYPTRSLVRNPWLNYVRYEAEVAAKLDAAWPSEFYAARCRCWRRDLSALELVQQLWPAELISTVEHRIHAAGGRTCAEEALRFLLDNGLGQGLDGPLGLADSAQWATGAAEPTLVPSFADNWNVSLSLMAMLEYLDDADRASKFFATLPEVKAALDTVFVAGDYSGDGVVNAADYNLWRNSLGSRTALAADGNSNGVIDAGDYTIWRDHLPGAAAAIPEPTAWLLALLGLAAWRWSVVRVEGGLATDSRAILSRQMPPPRRRGQQRIETLPSPPLHVPHQVERFDRRLNSLFSKFMSPSRLVVEFGLADVSRKKRVEHSGSQVGDHDPINRQLFQGRTPRSLQTVR